MKMRPSGDIITSAPRYLELLVGIACSLIGVMFASLLIFMTYVVTWRNPLMHGRYDMTEPITILLLAVLIVIATFFVRMAYLLLMRPQGAAGLLSPIVLRFWGVLFAVAGFAVLISIVREGSPFRAYSAWTSFLSTLTMAGALFRLAQKRNRGNRSSKKSSQQGHGA